MGTQWKPTSDAADSFEGCCRTQGDVRWTASRVDLVFGSNSELRALAEVYACDDANVQVRARLRRRLGQGDESRSLRSRLIIGSPSDAQRRRRRGAAATAQLVRPRNSFRTAALEDPGAAR
jgi:hypothetical protein